MELRAVIYIICCLIRFAVTQYGFYYNSTNYTDYNDYTEIINETTTIGYLSLEDECNEMLNQLGQYENGCEMAK